jgi:glutathione S-transferase
MNPHGRVPVIEDSGVVVWESHAILRYLAAKYASGTSFWNADPAERAKADQWMDWSQTALQIAFLMGIFWGWYRTPEAKRNMSVVNAAIERTNGYLRHVDRHLDGNSFMLGDGLSLADIPIGTHLYRYFRRQSVSIRRWAPTVFDEWAGHSVAARNNGKKTCSRSHASIQSSFSQ